MIARDSAIIFLSWIYLSRETRSHATGHTQTRQHL